MRKAQRYDRMSLKNRLACIMMIYLDGLNTKKKAKLKNYIDDKLGDVVDYYVRLLKKKKIKEINGPIKLVEIERLCPENKGNTQVENVNIAEPSLQ